MSVAFNLHKELMSYFSNKRKNYRENTSLYKDIVNNQIIFEKNFIEKNKVCKTGVSKLSNINSVELKEKLNTEFYDPKLMESMRCIMDLILNGKNGKVSEMDRIHKYIQNPVQFGTPSANGIALKSEIKNKPGKMYNGETVVIKFPQDPKKSNELIHETAIGFVLNNLRKDIPNFSYVYDTFSCSSPVIDPRNKKILLWCVNDENKVAYAIYENINNSKPIYSWALSPFELGSRQKDLVEELMFFSNWDKKIIPFIKEIEQGDFTNGDKTAFKVISWKTQEFILYYLQILLALRIANNKYDFTHYDLHSENALIRKYSDDFFYIPYEYKGKTKYLLSPGGIATVIDYGMSHVNVDGKDIGILDSTGSSTKYDINYNKSDIMKDAYKLLCFMTEDAIYSGGVDDNEMFDICMKLLSFFYQNVTKEETQIIIKEQRPLTFELPNIFKFNIEDLIDYVLDVLKLYPNLSKKAFLDKVDSDLIFGCKNACKNVSYTIKEIGLGISKIPSFFDVYDSKSNSDNIELINNFNRNFNESYKLERLEIDPILSYENKLFIVFPYIEDIEDSYRIMYENYYPLLDSIENIAVMLQNISTLSNEFNYVKYFLSIDEIKNKDILEQFAKEIIHKKNTLLTDISKIKSDIISSLSQLKKIKNLNEEVANSKDLNNLIKIYENVCSNLLIKKNF